MRAGPSIEEDVRQRLALRLLVAEGGGRPRIAEYSGRGSLATWVRVAAVRVAVDLLRKRTEELVEPNQRGAGQRDGEPRLDPELDYLKRRYAGEFRAAIRESVSDLPDDLRELLRLNVLEGLNIEAIGELKNVHRATVARRIAAARIAILEDTRRRLGERLGVATVEFESLAGVLASQLDLSLATVLRGPGDRKT